MMVNLWLATLVDSSLKGIALCFAAGAAATVLGRASAATRHLVWRLAFVGLLALPVLAPLLPGLRVPLPTAGGAAHSVAMSPRSSDLPNPPRSRKEEAGLSLPAVSSAVFEPPADRVQPYRWAFSWQAVVFGIWLTGAVSVLASLGIALLRVRGRRRLARPIDDEAWTGLLDGMRAELGIRRPVRLVADAGGAMPMTWGWRRPVVLLPAGTADWPEGRRRTVLLHELAHIARGDFLTQLTAEVSCALYWFNPLVWIAARELRLESEHACDDEVLAAGCRPADYAADLLEIARSLRAVRLAAAAGLAMTRPSQLRRRLLAVLDTARNRRRISRRLALPAWLAASCVVFPLAALSPSVSPSVFGSVKTFESSKNGLGIKIRTTGSFELTDDWNGIARLSRGAEMQFDEGDGRRRLDVKAGADGRPVYVWRVGGVDRTFDAEGKAWLQSMLLHFVRGTGYDAERRVAWFLQRRGPDGLLTEISQIPGDYVKRRYFERLFASQGLEANVVQRAIAQAGKEIRSDYELAQALLAAAGSPALDPASAVALLRSARGIDSDFELAELLTAFVKKSALGDAAVLQAYGEAVHEIGSDYEHHRALSAAVQRRDLSQEALLIVLRSAREISSSYERATLLVETAGRYSLSGTSREAYLEAAGSISSSYDRQRAEAALGRGKSVSR